jgi:hypothetical protein
LVLLTGYCLGDEIVEVVMSGACGTNEGEEKIEWSLSVTKTKIKLSFGEPPSVV